MKNNCFVLNWILTMMRCTTIFNFLGIFTHNVIFQVNFVVKIYRVTVQAYPSTVTAGTKKISPIYLPYLHVILVKTESAQLSPRYWNPHWFCIDFIGFKLFYFIPESVCESACHNERREIFPCRLNRMKWHKESERYWSDSTKRLGLRFCRLPIRTKVKMQTVYIFVSRHDKEQNLTTQWDSQV